MDNTKEFTHLGLCAGYGGIELGLHRVIRTLRTVALCEIEAFACANLVSKMEAGLMDCAPIWTDLKTFPWAEFRDRVDILTSGYPCQPFSAAGKRAGTEDPRHLWPFIADGIRILRPKLCFFENVEGHISLGLREVIGELEQIGYTAAWGIFSASEVGAPHQRKRVFILAVSNSLGGAAGVSRSLAWNERITGEFDHGGGEGVGVAITLKQGLQWRSSESLHSRRLQCEAGRSGDIAWPSRPGEPQHAWEPPRVVADAGSKQQLPRPRRDLEHNAIQPAQCNDGCGHSPATMANTATGQQDADNQRANGEANGEAMGNAEQFLLPATREHGAMDEASGIPTDRKGSEPAQTDPIAGATRKREGDGGNAAEFSETEPSVGGDLDGPASGMDYAELQVTCDNRTDELRLLGNGVVPATAERAFLTLMQELLKGTN